MEEQELKILWLTENYFPQKGGMAESCDRIVSGLRGKGHAVDVGAVCRRAESLQVEKKLNGIDILTPANEPAPHSLNRLWNQIERLHREQPYECVVAFGGTTPMIAGPVYSRWLSAPLVSCIRGNDFDTAIFSPNRRWILESCLNSSDVICTVSKDKLERVKGLFPSHRVEYVPNGIDCSRWEALPSDKARAEEIRQTLAPNKPHVLGLFGHLKAKKGLCFFLDVLASLPQAANIHLLLVGEIEEGILDAAPPCSYTVVPFQDRFELIPYYLACDAVVLPSFYDGLPNVLLEASGLGRICIASAVGGSPDVLKPFEEFLFHADDVADCREKLLSALRLSATDREQKASALMKHVRTNFSAETEIEEYATLLASCCRHKNSSALRELLQ